jgi:hypothetical protein
MVPVYLIFPNDLIIPVHIALIILAVFDSFTLFFLIKFVSHFTIKKLSLVFISLAWIFNPYIISTSLNGMETIISLFFIVTTIFYSHKIGFLNALSLKPAKFFLLGVLLGFAIFTRIDNVILLFSYFLITFYYFVIKRKNITFFLKAYIWIFAGIILVYSPWLIYSYCYTGDLYPISGKAVRLVSQTNYNDIFNIGNIYFFMFKQAVKTIIFNNGILFVLLGFLLANILFFRKYIPLDILKKKFELHNSLLIYSLILISAYIFYIFTPWFFIRYLFPVVLLLLVYFVTLADVCNEYVKSKKSRLIINSALIVLIVVGNVYQSEFQSLYFSKDSKSLGYMNIGLWAKNNFEDGTIIGSLQTGGLGYFADNLIVVNLDGVVNKQCYYSMINHRNMEYIKNNKIEYILGWELNIDFIKILTSNYRNDDLQLIKRIEGIKSWGHEWFLYKVSLNRNLQD